MENESTDERQFAHTQAWKTAEWFEELTVWSRKALEKRNMVMQGTMRQVEHSADNMVMTFEATTREERAEEEGTSCESIFIKCTVPVTREVERTLAAGIFLGDFVPEVIGVNRREGILMQRDAGKVTKERFDQEALIDTILKMQVLSMSRINELERGGLGVRDSEWVEANVESILNHRLLDDFCTGRAFGKDDDEVAESRVNLVKEHRSLIGEIQKKCRKITELGLPRTIVHGDCSIRNIGYREEHKQRVYRLFDWEKSFIGNPLHDFQLLLGIGRSSKFSSDFPELFNDWDAGVKQVWKRWKPCSTFTAEETMEMFSILSGMAELIDIHRLAEQYDACHGRSRTFIFDRLIDSLSLLDM